MQNDAAYLKAEYLCIGEMQDRVVAAASIEALREQHEIINDLDRRDLDIWRTAALAGIAQLQGTDDEIELATRIRTDTLADINILGVAMEIDAVIPADDDVKYRDVMRRLEDPVGAVAAAAAGITDARTWIDNDIVGIVSIAVKKII